MTGSLTTTGTAAGPANSALGDRLRFATTGHADTPLVLLGNFEVEIEWAAGQARLPSVSAPNNVAIVNRMDDLAVWLGTGRDLVVLKSAPDPGFLDHVRALLGDPPEVHVVRGARAERSVGADAGADPATLARLRERAGRGAQLLPHGTSTVEQDVADRAGIALATPDAALCREVNSKVFSRRLADAEGIRQPEGIACDDVRRLGADFTRARAWLADGPVVVKEAYGVSGKGMVVVNAPARLDRVRQLIEREAARGRRVGFTVERWVDGVVDLNYQLTIDAAGTCTLDTVKVALTENGIHRGHRMPVSLAPTHRRDLAEAAQRVGRVLARRGYRGVAGIDALIERDGTFHPVIEINARNNMATYQLRIQERLIGAGGHALARHYGLALLAPVSFDRVADALGGLLCDRPGAPGVVVHGFAAVNAAFTAAGGAGTRPGRLHVVVVGGSRAEVDRIDAAATAGLALLSEAA